MNCKPVVPAPISRAIGGFGLSRDLLVRLIAAIHTEVPRDYEGSRRFRMADFDRAYRYRIVLFDEQLPHVFRMAVDDSTAEGHLILVAIRHETRPRPPQV